MAVHKIIATFTKNIVAVACNRTTGKDESWNWRKVTCKDCLRKKKS